MLGLLLVVVLVLMGHILPIGVPGRGIPIGPGGCRVRDARGNKRLATGSYLSATISRGTPAADGWRPTPRLLRRIITYEEYTRGSGSGGAGRVRRLQQW